DGRTGARRSSEARADHGRFGKALFCQACEEGGRAVYGRGLELLGRPPAMPSSEWARILGVIRFWMGEYRAAVEALKEAELRGHRLGRSLRWAGAIAIWQGVALGPHAGVREAAGRSARGIRGGPDLDPHHRC